MSASPVYLPSLLLPGNGQLCPSTASLPSRSRLPSPGSAQTLPRRKRASAASRLLRTQSIKAQHSLGTCGHRTVKCAIKGSSAVTVKWLLTSLAGSTGRLLLATDSKHLQFSVCSLGSLADKVVEIPASQTPSRSGRNPDASAQCSCRIRLRKQRESFGLEKK